jgi:hypothetical protein
MCANIIYYVYDEMNIIHACILYIKKKHLFELLSQAEKTRNLVRSRNMLLNTYKF